MKCKKMIFVALIYLTGSCASYGIEVPYEDYKKNAIQEIKLYKDVMISNIRTKNENGAEMYKIIISKKKLVMQRPTSFFVPAAPNIVGEPIWEITPELPLTEDECLISYADPCDEGKNKLYNGSCFKPCIGYGPEFLDYDEKKNKIYFSAESVSIGTGGGPHFLFVADVNKKKIQYLMEEHGPFSGVLSPQGTYLILYGFNHITIINTITMKKDELYEKNDWTAGKEKLHSLGDIKWINETQFSYQDGVRHSKFQPSYDEQKENVYDISSKKIIKSRMMGKNEYNSEPYVEPN